MRRIAAGGEQDEDTRQSDGEQGDGETDDGEEHGMNDVLHDSTSGESAAPWM